VRAYAVSFVSVCIVSLRARVRGCMCVCVCVTGTALVLRPVYAQVVAEWVLCGAMQCSGRLPDAGLWGGANII
jgi:hypothetical protein